MSLHVPNGLLFQFWAETSRSRLYWSRLDTELSISKKLIVFPSLHSIVWLLIYCPLYIVTLPLDNWRTIRSHWGESQHFWNSNKRRKKLGTKTEWKKHDLRMRFGWILKFMPNDKESVKNWRIYARATVMAWPKPNYVNLCQIFIENFIATLLCMVMVVSQGDYLAIIMAASRIQTIKWKSATIKHPKNQTFKLFFRNIKGNKASETGKRTTEQNRRGRESDEKKIVEHLSTKIK